MKDIARDLGVSVITISKVLRNHPDVGDETRERVLARVKELDYRPNLAARSLVTGRTYLVGLVAPDLLHPFFAEIAKSLSDVLRESGYYLIISSSEEDPNLEEQEINHLLARRLDMLIVASCRSTVDLFFRIPVEISEVHRVGPIGVSFPSVIGRTYILATRIANLTARNFCSATC